MTKSKKKIIAIDIDEVLMPHFQDLIDYYNRLYGTSLTLEDNHPKDSSRWGTPSMKVAIRRVEKFFDTNEFKNSTPFEDSKKAIKILSDNFTLVVITARDEIIKQTTKNWLEKHFPEFFKEVHFTSMYNLEGKARTKGEVAKSIKADYLVDDNFDHIIAAYKHGVKGLLFGNYPWSSNVQLPKGVIRANDWNDVLDYFNLQC